MEYFYQYGRSALSAINREPLIVVEETERCEIENETVTSTKTTPRQSLDTESPVNPYLLSPWRDPREIRKHSLPSQQVTDGITASQVRRLSERGGEGSGPSPKEAAFLATLSQAPAPSGRRHSVVTISKVPTTLFGRCRRESIAAVPSLARRDSSRRESVVGPPATDPRGSVHNLQLDIMDDIVQARKARLKVWNTSSEKVCEVQTVSEAGSSAPPMRYSNRRYSEMTPTTSSATIALSRRPSELPQTYGPRVVPGPNGAVPKTPVYKKSGIVVTNTDLISIISSMASSATEINKLDDGQSIKPKSNTLAPEPEINRSCRSNSFDVSILHNTKQKTTGKTDDNNYLTGWFTKRHQPLSKKRNSRSRSRSNSTVSFSKDVLDKFKDKETPTKEQKKPISRFSKLKREGRHALSEAHLIGSAIEGFLRKSTSSGRSSGSTPKEARSKKSAATKSYNFWFGKEDEDGSDTCDSSLCSTLKDLFVK